MDFFHFEDNMESNIDKKSELSLKYRSIQLGMQFSSISAEQSNVGTFHAGNYRLISSSNIYDDMST